MQPGRSPADARPDPLSPGGGRPDVLHDPVRSGACRLARRGGRCAQSEASSRLGQGEGLDDPLVQVCVHTTVREANDRGFDCLVVEDCCGSYFPEFQEMGLRMIKAQGGIFGWVASSPAIIAAIA